MRTDVKQLVVDAKWLVSIRQRLLDELERVSQRLAGRIDDLADRYDQTLKEIDVEVAKLEERVSDHLQKMGYSWK